MLENQLSRYGSISMVIPNLAPGAKVFLVSDSDDTTVGPLNLGAEFPVDKSGVARVYTTIQAAVNAASSGRGDVVLVMPGYDHTLSRTDSWSTAGVKIVGLGKGLDIPIIRYGTKTDMVRVGANNISIANLRFRSDADSTARALQLDSGFSGAMIENCVFDFDSNGVDFRNMIRVSQPYTKIQNCEFLAEDTAGCGRAIQLKGSYQHLRVVDNYFYGQYDTVGDTSDGAAIITADSTDTADSLVSDIIVARNLFISTDTAATKYIHMDSTLTNRGILADNRFVSYDSATADTSRVDLGTGTNKGLRSINNLVQSDSGTEKRLGDTIVVLS